MSEGLESYSPVLDRNLEDFLTRDLGDAALDGLEMPEALDRITGAMGLAASQSNIAIMIGGEHTASLGGFRGVERVHPDAVILQLDAHLDMRPAYEGLARTHPTWRPPAGQRCVAVHAPQTAPRT